MPSLFFSGCKSKIKLQNNILYSQSSKNGLIPSMISDTHKTEMRYSFFNPDINPGLYGLETDTQNRILN